MLPIKNDTLTRDPKEIMMSALQLRMGALSAALAILAASSSGALAQKKYDVGATDFAPIEQLQMMQFKGGQWQLFGDIISAETGG